MAAHICSLTKIARHTGAAAQRHKNCSNVMVSCEFDSSLYILIPFIDLSMCFYIKYTLIRGGMQVKNNVYFT